jgi:hypothetical protein
MVEDGEKYYSRQKFECLRSVLRGVPFARRGLSDTWKGLIAPRFPVLGSLVSGISLSIPLFLEYFCPMAAGRAGGIKLPIGFVMYCVAVSSIIVLLNAFQLGWFSVILRHTQSDAENGARRVAYFATFYQAILFACLAAASLADGPLGYPNWFMTVSSVLIVCLATVRLAIVFQCMRLETKGSIGAGFMGTLVCFDVWFVYWLVLNSL